MLREYLLNLSRVYEYTAISLVLCMYEDGLYLSTTRYIIMENLC